MVWCRTLACTYTLLCTPTHTCLYSQRGWQWLFLAEGVPTIFLGLATRALLPSSPAAARFLSPADKRWLAGRVEASRKSIAAAAPAVVASPGGGNCSAAAASAAAAAPANVGSGSVVEALSNKAAVWSTITWCARLDRAAAGVLCCAHGLMGNVAR